MLICAGCEYACFPIFYIRFLYITYRHKVFSNTSFFRVFLILFLLFSKFKLDYKTLDTNEDKEQQWRNALLPQETKAPERPGIGLLAIRVRGRRHNLSTGGQPGQRQAGPLAELRQGQGQPAADRGAGGRVPGVGEGGRLLRAPQLRQAQAADPQDEEGPRHLSARHSAPVPAHALRLAPQPRQSPPSLRAHLQEGTAKRAACRLSTHNQVGVVVKMGDN